MTMTQTTLLVFIALGTLAHLLTAITAGLRLVVSNAVDDVEIIFGLVGVLAWMLAAYGATGYSIVTDSGIVFSQSSDALLVACLAMAGLALLVVVFSTTRVISPYRQGEAPGRF